MLREFSIIEALWPTGFPVPRPIAYCDDRSVCEVHFYAMQRSPGRALYTPGEVAEWLDPPGRRCVGEEMADVLAALHSINPVAVGLGNLGRHEGYISRQLATWYSSWTTHSSQAAYDDDRVHALHEVLAKHQPSEGPPRIVHGDFGPHNVLVGRDGRIAAVLDWEIATLGDPLADLAYTVTAWAGPDDIRFDVPEPATSLAGFANRQQLLDRYISVTGDDLSHFAFYESFNLWKRACIVHSVYSRYRSGQKSAHAVDLDLMLARMSRLLDSSVRLSHEFAN